MKKDILKAYIELKQGLPAFEELDGEFNISELDNTEGLVRNSRRKIAEKFYEVCQIFEEILQPDTSVTNLYESRVFDEDGKGKIFEVYRQLMVLKRRADKLEVMNDESQDAVFVSDALKEWKRLKVEVVEVIDRLESSWNFKAESTDRLFYFG